MSLSSPSHPGCLHYLLFIGASVYVIVASVLIHLIAWGVEQILLFESIYSPWYAWLLISLGHASLLALLIVPLAIFVRAPRLRAAYQSWAIAIAFLAFAGLARVVSAMQLQLALLAFIVVAWVAFFVLSRLARGRALSRGSDPLPVALVCAPIIAAPMIAFGALGSLLDTLMGFAAGLSLGAFAGALLDLFLFQPVAADESKPSALFSGISASVTLTILASAFGAPGTQLLLLVALPSLGFLLAALRRRWLAMSALVGLAAAATLIFFDPVELGLILGLPTSGEMMDWAVRAVGMAWLIATIVGVIALLIPSKQRTFPRGLAWGGATLAWIALLALFLLVGRPGLYGEELFVILKDQADVTRATTIPDRNERLRFVYSTLTQHADRSQTNLRATLDRVGIQYQPYYLVNALVVSGGPIVRAYLAAQPEVDRVIDNPRLRPLPAPIPIKSGDLSAPEQLPWNITFIGADRVWKELGVTGKGMVVGQSDSGVQGDHPALHDGYRGRTSGGDYNWLDPWYASHNPTDIAGHGTHTLGSILGRGGIGVASDAEWIACVNLARNLGSSALYLDCMQFMLAPYPQSGNPLRDGDPTRAAHVLNNSWGCPPIEGCDANSLRPAVNALRAAGIFVVVSVGNNGPLCASVIEPLAIYDAVLSVGAIDSSGRLAPFSSRGPVTVDGSNRIKPNILAPGVDVISSFPGNTFASEAGTSMAGPHVVGVVALMWSANPKLIGDIDRTEKILIETAQPYKGGQDACAGTELPNNAIGFGIVDAYAAVRAAMGAK